MTISYRGTAGTTDLVSALDKSPMPLSSIAKNFSGKGHAGYTLAYSKINGDLSAMIQSHSIKHHLSPSEMEIVVEGYSRGAHFAKLALLSLALDENLKNASKIGLFYADGNTLDIDATAYANNIIGSANMASFRTEGDLIANYPSVSNSQLGLAITFSPQSTGTYSQRVTMKTYTDMDASLKSLVLSPFGPFALSFLGDIGGLLTPDTWEAHVDITYRECAPGAYTAWKQTQH